MLNYLLQVSIIGFHFISPDLWEVGGTGHTQIWSERASMEHTGTFLGLSDLGSMWSQLQPIGCFVTTWPYLPGLQLDQGHSQDQLVSIVLLPPEED